MNLFVLGLTTCLSISTLYAPQPLLPILVVDLGLAPSQAALLIAVTMFPLGTMPLMYGLLLESFSAKTMLILSTVALAVTNLGLFFSHIYWVLFLLRLLQGGFISAILTCSMTLLAKSSNRQNTQKYMSYYIAFTIIGGFLGRLVSSGIASFFSWRYSFLALFLSLLFCFLLQGKLKNTATFTTTPPKAAIIWSILSKRQFIKLYLIIFCVFFVFSSILNFIPFRVSEIEGEISELKIGLMYLGYLVGIATSLFSKRILVWMGNEAKVILGAQGLMGMCLICFIVPTSQVIFGTMFLFCGMLFLLNSVISGALNRLAVESQGLINGLFIAFYYSAGMAGTYLPGLFYQSLGWHAFILIQGLVLLLGMTIGWFYKQQPLPK